MSVYSRLTKTADTRMSTWPPFQTHSDGCMTAMHNVKNELSCTAFKTLSTPVGANIERVASSRHVVSGVSGDARGVWDGLEQVGDGILAVAEELPLGCHRPAAPQPGKPGP